MSKKNGFGKFILFCAAAGAAAAGAYYYLTKRDQEIANGFDDDDFEDYDDFEDDEDYSTEIKFGNRKYVDIKSGDEDDSIGSEEKAESDAFDSDDEKKPESSEEFFNDEK